MYRLNPEPGPLPAEPRLQELPEGASAVRTTALIPGSPWANPCATESTETVVLELTSKCNLRCTYCSVSQADYVGKDMSEVQEELFFQGLLKRPPVLLVLNGHGETTMIPGWEKRVRRYIDLFSFGVQFLRVHAERVEALSRFQSLNISLDTHDAKLLATVRRRMKLENVLANLQNIRHTAAEHRRVPPEIHIFCTVYDRNVFHLDAFAEFLLPLKVTGVHWGNLMRHPDIDDGINVNVLTSLPPAEQRRAYQTIARASNILRRAGVHVGYWGEHNYFEAMERALDHPNELPVKRMREQIQVNQDHSVMLWENSFVRPCGPGETRDCLDPWSYAHLEASGGVLPCCVRGGPVGVVRESVSLGDVINNGEARKLRENLLRGTLDPECATCAVRGPVSLSAYRIKVFKRYLHRVLVAQGEGSRPQRVARRLLSDKLPLAPARRAVFNLLKYLVPESILRWTAGAYPADVPRESRETLWFENVRRGYYGLGERIYLRPNPPRQPAAAVCFRNVALDGVSAIGFSAKPADTKGRHRLRCVLLSGSTPVLVKEEIVSEGDAAWTIPLAGLSGPHQLRIECELEAGAVPVDLLIDYPLLCRYR